MLSGLSDETLNIVMYVLFTAEVAMVVWFCAQCWVNRKSQWKRVGVVDGIIYLQHVKHPRRRMWEVPPVRGRLKTQWLDNKTDVLE